MLTRDWREKPLPGPLHVYSSYLEDVFSTRPQVCPVVFPRVPVLALTSRAQFWMLLSREDRASEVVGGAHSGLIRPYFLQLPGGAQPISLMYINISTCFSVCYLLSFPCAGPARGCYLVLFALTPGLSASALETPFLISNDRNISKVPVQGASPPQCHPKKD